MADGGPGGAERGTARPPADRHLSEAPLKNVWKMAVRFVLLAVFVLLQVPVPLMAKVYMTKDEALKSAFPDARKVERKTVFLTDEDVKTVEKESGTKVASKLFTYYRAVEDGRVSGYAVIEAHTVRTKPAVYMAVIRPDGTLKFVSILAFYEPEDYIPPERWLRLFEGKRLDRDLWIRRGMPNITGATLSAYTTLKEVRKVLSIMRLKVLGDRR